MKIVILGNLRMNKENITLETKVHQTITTDRKNSNYRGSSENRNGSTSYYSRNSHSKENYPRNNSRSNYSRSGSDSRYPSNSYSRSGPGNSYSANNYSRNGLTSKYLTGIYSRNGPNTRHPRNDYSRSQSGPRTHEYPRNGSKENIRYPRSISRDNTRYSRRYDSEQKKIIMTVDTMTDLEMKGIIMDKIRAGITDIQMRITVLDNPTMNEEDILETEAHQTTITETEEVQITEAHQKMETVQPETTLEIHTQEITIRGITSEDNYSRNNSDNRYSTNDYSRSGRGNRYSATNFVQIYILSMMPIVLPSGKLLHSSVFKNLEYWTI